MAVRVQLAQFSACRKITQRNSPRARRGRLAVAAATHTGRGKSVSMTLKRQIQSKVALCVPDLILDQVQTPVSELIDRHIVLVWPGNSWSSTDSLNTV